MQDELFSDLEKLFYNINSLDSQISTLSKNEQEFHQNPSLLTVTSIETLEHLISNSFHEIQKSFNETLTTLNSMIVDEESPVDLKNENYHIPSTEEVQRMMNEFFKGNIKKSSHPLPNCGCYAHLSKNPHYGDFICAKYNNSHILMIVLKFENKICYVFDPTAIDKGINVVELQLDEWTPLPTVIPETPTSRYEHWKHSQVLSLWKLENAEWTTEFYNAKVLYQPCDRKNERPNMRGYTLDFGDNAIVVVPEQYVVKIPENW